QIKEASASVLCMDRVSGESEPRPLIKGHIMVNELTKKSNAWSVCWIVLIDETQVGISYQCFGTRGQIVVRIHDPARSTEVHQSVANRIRGRCERRSVEHPTKMPGQRWIRRRFSMGGLGFWPKPKHAEADYD